MDAQDKSFIIMKKKKLVIIEVYEKLLNYKIQQITDTKDYRIVSEIEEDVHDIIERLKMI